MPYQHQPLAERMRPAHINQLVGQSHLIGENGILRKSLLNGNLFSMILWGPPGVGKTTIANVIAQQNNFSFFKLSATSSGVKEIKKIIDIANVESNTVLFIDEIHRFNKSQQDALLEAVEKKTIILIGVTTENPSFEINSALLSRCQVYTLKPLSDDDLITLINRVIKEDVQTSTKLKEIKEKKALLSLSNGDARKLLNLIELISNTISKK